MACARARCDSLDRGLNEVLVYGNLEFYLLEQATRLFMAPVDLGDPLLSAAAHNTGHGDQVYLPLLQVG